MPLCKAVLAGRLCLQMARLVASPDPKSQPHNGPHIHDQYAERGAALWVTLSKKRQMKSTVLRLFDNDGRRLLFRHSWNRVAMEQNVAKLYKSLNESGPMFAFRGTGNMI